MLSLRFFNLSSFQRRVEAELAKALRQEEMARKASLRTSALEVRGQALDSSDHPDFWDSLVSAKLAQPLKVGFLNLIFDLII